jgi:hypothetical protein
MTGSTSCRVQHVDYSLYCDAFMMKYVFIDRFQYLNVFLLYIEEDYLEFMMN